VLIDIGLQRFREEVDVGVPLTAPVFLVVPGRVLVEPPLLTVVDRDDDCAPSPSA